MQCTADGSTRTPWRGPSTELCATQLHAAPARGRACRSWRHDCVTHQRGKRSGKEKKSESTRASGTLAAVRCRWTVEIEVAKLSASKAGQIGGPIVDYRASCRAGRVDAAESSVCAGKMSGDGPREGIARCWVTDFWTNGIVWRVDEHKVLFSFWIETEGVLFPYTCLNNKKILNFYTYQRTGTLACYKV